MFYGADITLHRVEDVSSQEGKRHSESVLLDNVEARSFCVVAPKADYYRVWYGTNRIQQGLGYTTHRDDQVHYGFCDVVVPWSHEIGSVGSPWWKRLWTRVDDRLSVTRVYPETEKAFWRTIKKLLRRERNNRDAVIFLHAAPDVDTAVFRELAGVYTTLSERTTLYVSDADKALASSGLLHQYPRAGFTPPITIVPNIDTVRVTNVDLTLLGHGYIGEARDVLHDMHSLLNRNAPPKERMGLRKLQGDDGGFYWEIGK